MAIILDREQGLLAEDDEQIGLDCPYCGVYAHMSPQSVPRADDLLAEKPKYVGLVYQCDACKAPVFLRFGVREYRENQVELYQNFIELERPKERFSYSYLPKHTEVLFREALTCYGANSFNAFASMCRRSAASAYAALGERGKLRAFEVVLVAQEIAGIDDDSFRPIKKILFESGEEEDMPLLNRAQAGILLEILKDMFYQCFVRRGKLTRAIKVRQFFVEEGGNNLKSTA
jgi:hypothetical protein